MPWSAASRAVPRRCYLANHDSRCAHGLLGVTKSALVQQVAAETQLSRRDAVRAVEAVLALIERELRGGGQVSLAGFGKFHTARRGARAGVNPRTGEPMTVGATTVPRFTAGSALKKAVREL